MNNIFFREDYIMNILFITAIMVVLLAIGFFAGLITACINQDMKRNKKYFAK